MTPEGNRAVLQAALPEAILTPYCADPPALPHADGYVVGCGLGTSASAYRVLEEVLQAAEASAPVVDFPAGRNAVPEWLLRLRLDRRA